MAKLNPVHVDDRCKILFQEGDGEEAAVSFTGIIHKLGGIEKPEIGKSVSGERDVYYVMDLGQSWYNHCYAEILQVLQSHLAARGRNTVFTIGNSMGGFGALLFARDLPNCKTAIAFVPQSSVSPAIVPFENRYDRFVRNISEWSVPDCLPFLAPGVSYKVLYGSECWQDREHAARLKTRDDITLSTFEFAGSDHNLAKNLKSSGHSLRRLINGLLHTDAVGAQLVRDIGANPLSAAGDS